MIFETTVQYPYHAFNWIKQIISEDGRIIETRGKKTKELLQVFVEILSPQYARIPIDNYKDTFILQEVKDILTENSVTAIHSEEMLEYTMGSPTAKFFFGEEVREALSNNSLERIQNLFVEDIHTRKAVLDLGNRNPEEHIPCLTFAHFIIRQNRFYCTVETRSTDLVFGFPYDIFLFSTVQRILLNRLNRKYPKLKLGSLCYKSISMHYYLGSDETPLKNLKCSPTSSTETLVTDEYIKELDKYITNER